MVYTITFNPALDYVMKVDGLRLDDINRTVDEAVYYGGKGINVSVILTRLGIENKALGFAAGFTGAELERLLRADGIDCDFNYLKSGYTRINVKIKADTEIDVNANGPAITEDEIAQLIAKLDKVQSGDFLVLAGSIPKTLPNDIYERILEKLSGKGVHFVVDATGDLLMNVLKYKPFLIKPNHHELGDMFGVKTQTDCEIEKYAGKLQALGARNVLVSRASKGAMLIDENGAVHSIGVAQGRLVNSVGCGDSMVGGFIAGYIEKNDYAYALKLGSACGNATAFSASLAAADEIMDVFNNGFNN